MQFINITVSGAQIYVSISVIQIGFDELQGRNIHTKTS
jgi:hypothetical protein